MPQRDIQEGYLWEHYPVAASTSILEGSVVCQTASAVTAANRANNLTFLGLALRAADNSAGAASAIEVPLLIEGIVKNVAVNDVDATTRVGTPVYATGVNSFTLLATGGTLVGTVSKVISEDVADVFFQAASRQSE